MNLTLTVPKLMCGACVEAVTQAVQAVDPAAEIQADPQTKAVIVTTSLTEVTVRDLLNQAGYPPQ